MNKSEISKLVSIDQRIVTKSLNTLMGIVNGVICDDNLSDTEVQFLSVWMSENRHIASAYPANIIFRRVSEVLADGVITTEERDQLLKELKTLSGNDFSNTGVALPDHIQTVFDDDPLIVFEHNTFVFTGEFMYGTRQACFRAVQKRGGVTADIVTKKTNYLVVGAKASPDWIVENFGRKIQKAAEMAESGVYEISIVREVDWVMAI